MSAAHQSSTTLQPFVVAALIMTTLLHAVASVSRPYSNFVLATIRVLLHGAFAYCNRVSSQSSSTLTAHQRNILRTVPKDVRTALKALGVAPDIVHYACCPRCFQIYPPNASRPDDPYPRRCTFSETDKDRCNTPLVVAREATGRFPDLRVEDARDHHCEVELGAPRGALVAHARDAEGHAVLGAALPLEQPERFAGMPDGDASSGFGAGSGVIRPSGRGQPVRHARQDARRRSPCAPSRFSGVRHPPSATRGHPSCPG